MKRAWRKDKNQKAIDTELKEKGYGVADTSRLGDGFADAVVAKDCPCPQCGYVMPKTVLVEYKSLGGQLTKKECEFMDSWPGDYVIAFTIEDVTRRFG